MIALLFISMDSFLGAAALAMLGLPSQRKRTICLLFGLCDAAATYIGRHIGSVSMEMTRSNHSQIALAAIGAWILAIALVILCVSLRKPTGLLTVSLVPIVFSIDNLVAGGFSSQPSQLIPVEPAVAFLLSTTLAGAGCAMASALRSHLPEPAAICAGASLLCLTPILF